MIEEQDMETVTTETLLEKAGEKKRMGNRLVQISATRMPDQVELTYSFDLDSRLTHLRLSLPPEGSRVPSICSVYACSVLYENELHDLFEVQVEGLALDFKGGFYRTAVKFPFGSTKAPCTTSASTPPGVAPAVPA